MTFDNTIYRVIPVEREDVRDFIETHHYSHSINGVRSKYCFGLVHVENDALPSLIGAALFGSLGMANTWRKYGTSETDVIELRRLVCIDNTPKNTESYFISRCIRWLKQNTSVKIIVSYADENHGHTGVIYRASNFEYLGVTAPSKMIEYEGRLYHDKTIRTKYKGVLKPFASRIKRALEDGTAKYVDSKFKHIYVYKLAGDL